MFDVALKLFDAYCGRHGTAPTFNPHLAAEVQERLRQLQLIIKRVRQLESSHEESIRQLQTRITTAAAPLLAGPLMVHQAPTAAVSAMNEFQEITDTASTEIRILTEAFYYFACRIRTIARSEAEPLPHLTFECKGVRDVRNHLIEHPEGGNSQVFAQNYAFGGPQGPVLKQGRPANEPTVFADRGLYVNAEDFRSNLLHALERALATPNIRAADQ